MKKNEQTKNTEIGEAIPEDLQALLDKLKEVNEEQKKINFVPPVIPRRTRKGYKNLSKFSPTPEQKQQVMNLIMVGVPVERIAIHLGIDESTVAKHFQPEIVYGVEFMLANVAGALYQKAILGDFQSARFYMQTKGGWHQGFGELTNIQINFAAEDVKL